MSISVKLKVLFLTFATILISSCTQPEDGPIDSCAEIMIVPTITPYDELKSGFSCEEFKRRERSYSGCTTTLASSQNETAPHGEQSSQNTIISSVKEPQNLVYTNQYSYFALNKKIIINDLFNLKNEVTTINLQTINNKLFIYKNTLIILGEKRDEQAYYFSKATLSFYDIEDPSDIRKIKTITELNSPTLRLRDNHLFVKDYERALSNKINCQDIIYLDDSTDRGLTISYKVDLDSGDFNIKQERVFYGYLNSHIDERSQFFHKSFYNRAHQHESVLIKAHQKEALSSYNFQGHLPNNFALKEYGDHVAFFAQERLSTSLNILNKSLGPIAKISNIAPEEFTTSARFDGDKAFLATFKDIDPLFIFDLSEIEAPKLLSELKIPNSIRYLHTLKDDYLLGINRVVQGSSRELEFALFDISDLNSPRQTDSVILDAYYFAQHQNITIHGDIIVLKNPFKITVIKKEEKKLSLLGTIRHNSHLSNLLIQDNKLIFFGESKLRSFSLTEDLPEIE